MDTLLFYVICFITYDDTASPDRTSLQVAYSSEKANRSDLSRNTLSCLKENYNNCEVIAVSADVGQESELEGLEEKAIATGASKLYIEDLTDVFVDEFIVPSLKAGAKYEKYLLGTSFARPIIGKRLVEIAEN